MRAIAATSLIGVTVLMAVGLSAASSVGAATDGLTSEAILAQARIGQTFAGGAPRVTDDPDAPIRTGRWDDAPAPEVAVALAGGPAPAKAAPAPVLATAALTPPPSAEAVARAAGASPVIKSRVALASVRSDRLDGGPRMQLSVATDVDPTAPGSGLALSDTFKGESFVPRSAQPEARFDARRLLVSISPSADDKKKGRWFVFAAGSGEAFGLNLVRDPARGWRPAGWSVERLAEFGKAQLGIGWRKGDRQVAVSAARREIGAYGVKREDTVFGVTFTVSGKPTKAPRYEQRLPKR
jgi:hypothetical protein